MEVKNTRQIAVPLHSSRTSGEVRGHSILQPNQRYG